MNFGKPKVAQLPHATDLISAQMEVQEAFESLAATGVECHELATVVENISLATESIKTYGGKGVEIFNADGSLESFLGADVIGNAKKVEAALEGKFTDAMKNLWKKIREWFARLGDWFRKIFFSLEGDLKHLEGMVDAKNDKNFNPDAEVSFPIPTKAAIDACLRAANLGLDMSEKIYAEAGKGLDAISKIDLKKIMENGGEPPKELETLAANFKKIQEESAQAFEKDPILKNIQDAANKVGEAGEKGGPLAGLLAFNTSFMRSGKVSELGYKTGADIRGSVTELAKVIRSMEKQAPTVGKMLKDVDALIKKFDSVTESVGLGDFSKLAHGYMRGLMWINNQTTRLDRWIIMGVTRAVRQMYK